MQVINISTMKSAILHVALKHREPLWFRGPSGIGKTEAIHALVAEQGWVLCDFRASQWESVDFRGIPDVQSGVTVWNMPSELPFKGNPKFDEDGPIIVLFADEADHGEPSTNSVLYQLFNERRVGSHLLMDNVIIIAASNRAQDKGVHNRTPAPLNNRFTHYELASDVKSWSSWAAKAGVHSTVIGFLNFRQELLHTFDANNPVPAFATPRTWAKAASYFADEDMPADVRIASISGAVGEGPATELQGFADIMDSLVPIEEILKDPEHVKVNLDRLDLQWAMATHVSGHMNKQTVDQLTKFLNRLEPEMVVMAWTLAIARDEDITDTNAFLNDYAIKYRSLFQ